MINNETLKKQVIYRSSHRGIKEMDLLLGSFVKKNIHIFTNSDLDDLVHLLSIDDKTIFNWYTDKIKKTIIPDTKVSKLLKNFKI